MNIKDVNINYVQYGNSKGKDVVLLHGWGQNIEMMNPIGERLKNDYHITILDLPGFGKSSEPTYDWTIYDYYEMLKEFLKELKIKNPILIGHSFGGRISIIYASKEKVDKLVLLASPFRKSVKKDTLKIKILKFLKKVPLLKDLEDYAKTKIGSTDYRNASPVMRKILVNTVNEDLESCVRNIKVPTVLIWGDNDTAVSVEDARYMESIIPDAGLIVYEGCTHYAYLERLGDTINILKSFLGGK